MLKRLLTISAIATVAVRSQTYEFTYNLGGSDWNNGQCLNGTKQSPIDLPSSASGNSTNDAMLKLNSAIKILISENSEVNVTEAFNGHTFQVTFTDGGLVTWDSLGNPQLFELLQYHMHAPSEHTIDGKHYDLEIHLVHKAFNSSSVLTVVGIFFDMAAGGSTSNDLITALNVAGLANATSQVIPQVLALCLNLPLMTLLSNLNTNKLYSYTGSLTTPPCSEIVTWYVVNDPQPISSAQLSAINAKFKNNAAFAGGNGNNRATQALNGRTIYQKTASLSSSMSVILATGVASFIGLLSLF